MTREARLENAPGWQAFPAPCSYGAPQTRESARCFAILYKLILDLTDGGSWPISFQAALLSSDKKSAARTVSACVFGATRHQRGTGRGSRRVARRHTRQPSSSAATARTHRAAWFDHRETTSIYSSNHIRDIIATPKQPLWRDKCVLPHRIIFPNAESLPHLICSPAGSNSGAMMRRLSMATQDNASRSRHEDDCRATRPTAQMLVWSGGTLSGRSATPSAAHGRFSSGPTL